MNACSLVSHAYPVFTLSNIPNTCSYTICTNIRTILCVLCTIYNMHNILCYHTLIFSLLHNGIRCYLLCNLHIHISIPSHTALTTLNITNLRYFRCHRISSPTKIVFLPIYIPSSLLSLTISYP